MQDCLLTEEAEVGSDMIESKSTCKGSKQTQIMYAKVSNQKRTGTQNNKLVIKLRKDINLLKSMVKDLQLENQELRTKIEKDRLYKEIESPTFKLQQAKFKMQQELIKAEEKATKFEKEFFKTREELEETKKFYEERIQAMDMNIKRLQSENSNLLKDQQNHFMTV